MRQLALSVALTLLSTQAQAAPSVAVWDGRLPPSGSVKGELCNAAEIKGHYVVGVLNGPTRGNKTVGQLRRGDQVFVCSESGEWLGVVYKGHGRPCRGGTPAGLDVRRTPHCASGWVRKDQVDILSG
ncbi:hypothetical protein [Phenylobacterium sp.]|jgi:hypothetical protein|uniref:hypothetical protein n=1 Tax=Phenylobacterium sp. TaxID=1871053 RepID=UPI002F410D8C